MDTTFQIQEIKSQIINMNLRIENIEMQNNNMINSTGDQLLMLSFDMFNNGIKTYNLGKKLTMNFDKYFEQIKNISNQINNLINSYYLEKQLKMAQQQMAQQQMMQQQMMQQQMMAAQMQQRMMQMQQQQQQAEAAKQAQMQNILNNQGQGMGNQDTSQGQTQGFSVIFRASGATGQAGAPIMIQCTPNDKVSDIIEKYRNKANDRDDTKKFIFNAKNLNTSLSVAEAGITNNANIFVVATKGIKGAY